MKTDIPKNFLDQYQDKRQHLQDTLDQVTALLRLRLSQLAARSGSRGGITEARVKRPAKLWKNAQKASLKLEDVFTRVEDLLGVRIVCNNLSDVAPMVEMIRKDCSILKVLKVKDMISSPTKIGYRATHVRTAFVHFPSGGEPDIPCEIQIRTLSQDTWARLSRDDLYGRDVPQPILRLSQALSTQLSAIDEIGQLIRDELNQCPSVAEKIKDSDGITPQRLALLYKHRYEENIYEWTLIDWVRQLKEAEADKVGEVRTLLDNTELRETLDKLANRIRGFPLENGEWAVFSALAASESSPAAGIEEVKKRIQREWDEIVTVARGEALSGMPETIEEFIEDLESGIVPSEALVELGGIQSCYRCGNDILRPEQAAEAVLDYYGNPDIDVDLESLFEGLCGEGSPEVESVDFSGACQYCGYQMNKDD